MSFKKLLPTLKNNLEALNIVEPNDLQLKCLSKIKSGADLVIVSPKGTGKTTIMLINVINKLRYSQGDNPRAIIFVKDKSAAIAVTEQFEAFAKHTDLTTYPIFEEQQIEKQKDAIYLGADVVIGTPKRLAKLYYLNGLNLRELKMFIIDDADFLAKGNLHTDIIRLRESIQKCQTLILSEQMNSKIEKIKTACMPNSMIVLNE
jgi:superfamily II DNA/RNA helicase